ncbi:MAG: hypothetical protein QOK00_1969 [Thermoleophilaceae bacterium]|jgi:ABC-type transport system substrate-binding protein|nr:hypothetical protein [Thermoleophilaceae bacterium]
MIVSIRSIRKLLLPMLLLALVLGGCGGDDESGSSATTKPESTGTVETTTETQTEAQTETEPTTPDPGTETLPNDGNGNGVPEGGTGGAGDEEPAQTLALFTGDNGKITPSKVRVPAFISVRVELRSRDGAEYAVTFGGKTVKAGDGLSSVSTTFDGLRPGASLVGLAVGPGGQSRVEVEATAEPGP